LYLVAAAPVPMASSTKAVNPASDASETTAGDGVRVPCDKSAFPTLWEGPKYWLTFGAGRALYAEQAQGQAVKYAKAAMKLLMMTLAFAPELFALAAQGPPLFFGLGGDADDTHGFAIAAQIAIQFQGQFAGIGLVRHHPFMLRVELLRMHDKRGDPEGRQLAVQVKAAGSGFVYHKYLVSQGELFLHEGQEAGRREPLGGLRRLPIAHPHHAELLDVPVHGDFELTDSGLRFGIQRRIRFHRHV